MNNKYLRIIPTSIFCPAKEYAEERQKSVIRCILMQHHAIEEQV